MVELEKEKIVWIAIILLIIFLVWETLKDLIAPIVFGMAASYIAYPFHIKLSKKLEKKLRSDSIRYFIDIFPDIFCWRNSVDNRYP